MRPPPPAVVADLPSKNDLLAVSGGGGRPGAYDAAGWPADYYWTGELTGADRAFVVLVDNGFVGPYSIGHYYAFVCGR